jgi:protease I
MAEKKKAAILVADGFEDLELHYPRLRLTEVGMEVIVAGAERRRFLGKAGCHAEADSTISSLRADAFDAVIVPGGHAPDNLRTDQQALDFVRAMDAAGKPIATACHAASVAISAGIVRGRTMTCARSIRDDVRNAGAEHADKPVVVDGNLVSSRMPNDLPAFCHELIALVFSAHSR